MLEGYTDLRKSFVFYGSYHHNKVNQWIHLLGVPSIFTTALALAHPLKVYGNVSLSDVVAVVYALSFIKMEPTAGLLYAPVIGAMHYIATTILVHDVKLSLLIHSVAWVSQFVGHGVFEGRKPALFDNLAQSFHAAVFFVWLEFLFMLGYKPALHKELNTLIEKRMAQEFSGKKK